MTAAAPLFDAYVIAFLAIVAAALTFSAAAFAAASSLFTAYLDDMARASMAFCAASEIPCTDDYVSIVSKPGNAYASTISSLFYVSVYVRETPSTTDIKQMPT